MKTQEIIERFLNHFVNNGHKKVLGALTSLEDPNLLFVNAGMVQFVPYFLGKSVPPCVRITSIQKCIRTPDIEQIGITNRHNTFFQMAGNFSFGDYLKEVAIRLAWKLLTSSPSEGGYGLDSKKFWITVYLNDNETINLWKKVANIPDEQIQRRGMIHNYWSMGIPGPCGPCSEIYYDRGSKYGIKGGPSINEERYVEVWNLVFMENKRGKGSSKENFDILGRLPHTNIDTGMGIERIACILQNTDNVYETDLIRPVIDILSSIALNEYRTGRQFNDIHYRIVADHSRTAAIIICDYISPSNEGRGYVLRRILRRTIRSIKLLDVEQPMLGVLIHTVCTALSALYPELVTNFDHIYNIVIAEENMFNRTLSSGLKMFKKVAKRTRNSGSRIISGIDVFKLHDTYGFPLELTLEMASEANLFADKQSFYALMDEQKQRSKNIALNKRLNTDMLIYSKFLNSKPTKFIGLSSSLTEAKIVGIFIHNKQVLCINKNIQANEFAELILDCTPFYAESGGQLADRGLISGIGDSVYSQAEVVDVQKITKYLWVHRIKIISGEFYRGDIVTAAVDPKWRYDANISHSGTHVIHAAIKQVLGPNISQAGSLNRPGYLRFDFNWKNSLTYNQCSRIEEIANEAIGANYQVNTFIMGIDEAKTMGAVFIPLKSYPKLVRVVDIGGFFSLELCGGTHVRNLAQIRSISIVSESSIGAGIRRIEAYVGNNSFNYLNKKRTLVNNLSSLFKVPSTEISTKVAQLIERLKFIEKEYANSQLAYSRTLLTNLKKNIDYAEKAEMIAQKLPNDISTENLRILASELITIVDKQPLVVVLISEHRNNSLLFVITVNSIAQSIGLKANNLIKFFCSRISGTKSRGGGNYTFAQGSSQKVINIKTALNDLHNHILAG